MNLKQFLDNNEIPKVNKKPKTFLGIAKQPHYENVLSNIYAFYFDVNDEHLLENLFVNSLIECISDSKIEGKDFSNFSNFEIETEYSTKGIGLTGNKGRIDLLLWNENSAIIIENKVYHHLDNDLDDYWKSVKLDTEKTDSKIGVLLSLKPVSKDTYKQFETQKEYINITHLQFLKKVMKNLGDYYVTANEKYLTFLKDLYQNIINMSRPTMNERDINFYLENRKKINQLVDFKFQFRNHIISEIENAGESMDGVQLIKPRVKYNLNRLRYYQSKVHSELLYTIVFEDLMTDKNKLHIIIEPSGNSLKNGSGFKTIKFPDEVIKKEIIKKDFYSKTDKPWAHFASKSYSLTKDNLEKLSEFIQETIESDKFKIVFSELETYLTPKQK